MDEDGLPRVRRQREHLRISGALPYLEYLEWSCARIVCVRMQNLFCVHVDVRARNLSVYGLTQLARRRSLEVRISFCT